MTQIRPTTIDPDHRAGDVSSRPLAFLSYASEDAQLGTESREAIGRIETELLLRGFDVFRDTSFLTGGVRNETAIFAALSRATIYVPYLSSNFLTSDFCLREFKFATSPETQPDGLTVLPVSVGLGATREELRHGTWENLRYDFTSSWFAPWLFGFEPGREADFATLALEVAFPPGQGPADGEWLISVVSRGTPQAFDGLTVDASGLFGDSVAAMGSSDDWTRIKRAINDVEKTLKAHGARRKVAVSLSCHLSAAALFGFAFRQNASWRLEVIRDDARVEASPSARGSVIADKFEPGAFNGSGGPLAVAVNLLPRRVVEGVRASFDSSPRGYLWLARQNAEDELPLDLIGPTATDVAAQIRNHRDDLKPDRIDLFLSSPASFAALLGCRLGAVCCPVSLFEWNKATNKYEAVLQLKET